MADFAPCFCAMLREESGLPQEWGKPLKRGKWSYMNHPRDPGGATMMGVTHRVYDAWRARHGLETRDVRDIEDGEIISIFHDNYFAPVRGDILPPGVDLALYDFAVNSGPGRAVREIQACLGVRVDGHLGDVTLSAIMEAERVPLIYDLMDRRRKFCRSLSNYPSFKNGWEGRWDRIEAKAVALAAPNDLQVFGLVSGPVVDDGREIQPAGRATEPAPATSMARSTTSQSAMAIGGIALAGLGVAATGALSKTFAAGAWKLGVWAFAGTWTLNLFQTVEAWMAIGTLWPAAYIWFERKRKALLDGAAR